MVPVAAAERLDDLGVVTFGPTHLWSRDRRRFEVFAVREAGDGEADVGERELGVGGEGVLQGLLGVRRTRDQGGDAVPVGADGGVGAGREAGGAPGVVGSSSCSHHALGR